MVWQWDFDICIEWWTILGYHGIIIIWYSNCVKKNNGTTMSKNIVLVWKMSTQKHAKIMAHVPKTLVPWNLQYLKVVCRKPWYYHVQTAWYYYGIVSGQTSNMVLLVKMCILYEIILYIIKNFDYRFRSWVVLVNYSKKCFEFWYFDFRRAEKWR